MKPLFFAVVLLLSVGGRTVAPAATDSADGWRTDPLFDVRVRQELLDGVYHFAPDPDRNWIRVRTRGGMRFTRGGHRLEFRLVNEHRHHLDPEQRGDLDEKL